MINRYFLNNAKDADEILALVKKAEAQLAKLKIFKPVDGISGSCPLGSDCAGDYAQWIEQQAWPFIAPDDPGFEQRYTEKVRELAISLFAWNISLWARSVDWKLDPPHEVWLNKSGKQRRLFHFRTPLDKVVLNTLSLVLQASVAWPGNAHGWIVGRGVHTAAEQIKKFVSEGFVWTQTLDLKDAFASVNRVQLKKRLRVRFKAMCKNLETKALHKPDVKTRVAESWEFIERTIEIDHAVTGKDGALIDVSDVGLLQGSSVAPVYFNLLMEPLDKKFLWCEGAQVAYVRFADNIFVLARTREALTKGVAQIRSYCGQFGCKFRCEIPPTNILAEGDGVEFLGLVITINKHGSATAKLSRRAVSRFAKKIVAMPSHRKRRRGLRALFQHYAPGGFLPDWVLQNLAQQLSAALLRKDADAKMDIRYCGECSLVALRDDILKSLKMSSLMYDEDWNPDDEMYLMS